MSGVPSIEALEGAHEFPTSYLVKAFGPRDDAFVEAVRAAALESSAVESEVQLRVRNSSKGTYVSVSVEVWVHSAAQVQALYRAVLRVDRLKMLL